MNKKEVFAHYSHIMDDMLHGSLFFSCFFQNPTILDDNVYGDDTEGLPSTISIKFGATRGCIIDDDYDYVVKFDLDPSFGTKACSHELNVFNDAKVWGLDPYFSEVEYLGTYTRIIQFYDYRAIEKHFNWYAYYGDFDEDFMKEEENYGDVLPIVISIPLYGYKKASRVNRPRRVDRDFSYGASPLAEHTEVAFLFINEYGTDVFNSLSAFLEEENINDIHGGNIGLVDGHLVIIDYAGYNEY